MGLDGDSPAFFLLPLSFLCPFIATLPFSGAYTIQQFLKFVDSACDWLCWGFSCIMSRHLALFYGFGFTVNSNVFALVYWFAPCFFGSGRRSGERIFFLAYLILVLFFYKKICGQGSYRFPFGRLVLYRNEMQFDGVEILLNLCFLLVQLDTEVVLMQPLGFLFYSFFKS